MTAKEFLQQALLIYKKLDSKIEQLIRLKEISRKMTSVMSVVPKNTNGADSSMENAIVNVIARAEILSNDIVCLLGAQEKISIAISKIDNPDEKIILEYRYLTFKTWREISSAMRITIRHAHRLHDDAIKNFAAVYDVTKCH